MKTWSCGDYGDFCDNGDYHDFCDFGDLSDFGDFCDYHDFCDYDDSVTVVTLSELTFSYDDCGDWGAALTL